MKTIRTPIPADRRRLLLAALALGAMAACGRRAPKAQAVPAGATVLALGDSLTQGVGADPQHAYPDVLRELSGWNLVNAGVSGDTSAQALARLPDLLVEHHPALVLIGLGGNDFLRQTSASAAKDNLRAACRMSLDSGAQVVLIAVPQFSLLAASTGKLSDHPLYAELASELEMPLYAGGWSEVLGDARLRSDRVHANAEGYRQFADGLARRLRELGLLAR